MHDGPVRARDLAGLILAEAERSAGGPGGRLPTERQLAADLGVTRTAIRHAMAVLEAAGSVSREVGRGTFLRAPAAGEARPDLATDTAPAGAAPTGAAPTGAAPAVAADRAPARAAATAAILVAASTAVPADFAPADVMAVRRLIEPQVMALVVAWATARDLAEMDRCLKGGDGASGYEEFETWDAALHRCIIAASHSPLLVRLYGQVEAARQGKVWGDLKRRSASAERRAQYQQDHRDIVAALRLRDSEEAAAAMRTHLGRVSRHLLGGE